MAAEAEVVVAGQIQQGRSGELGGLERGGGGWLQAAQLTAARGRQGVEGVAQLLAPGGVRRCGQRMGGGGSSSVGSSSGGSGAAGGERRGAQDVPAAGTPVSLSWRLRQEGACRIAGVGDAMGGFATKSIRCGL